jgi:hypothetical protein
MKASELILQLEQAIAIHGDLEVTYYEEPITGWHIEPASEARQRHIDFT